MEAVSLFDIKVSCLCVIHFSADLLFLIIRSLRDGWLVQIFRSLSDRLGLGPFSLV